MDRLSRDVVHEICTNQVVVTLHACVKELVENSLDAGASRVEIRLRENGSDLLEVVDNGRGVAAMDYERLATRHATSKIRQYDDLSDSLSTFGFRGEALAGISAMGDVTVCTRTSKDVSATTLSYDRFGKLVDTAPVAREVGTTVSVRDLFKRLPVRHREFMRNAKVQVATTLRFIQAYAVARPDVCFQVVSEKRTGRNTLLTTSGSAKGWRQAAAAVLGDSVVENVVALEIAPTDSCGWTISGLISTPAGGRRSRDAQLFFVNHRPIEPPKRIVKMINDTYHQYNSRMWPAVILSFSAAQGLVDVNVTPDKRTVFLHKEEALVAELHKGLTELFGPPSQCALNVSLADFGIRRAGTTDGSHDAACAAVEPDATVTLESESPLGPSATTYLQTPEKVTARLSGAPASNNDELAAAPYQEEAVDKGGYASQGFRVVEHVPNEYVESMPGLSIIELAPSPIPEDTSDALSYRVIEHVPCGGEMDSSAGLSIVELTSPRSTPAPTSHTIVDRAEWPHSFRRETNAVSDAIEFELAPRESSEIHMDVEQGAPYVEDIPKLERATQVPITVSMAELDAFVTRRRNRSRSLESSEHPGHSVAPNVQFPGAFSLASLSGGKRSRDGGASLEEVAKFGPGPDMSSFKFDQSCFTKMRVLGQFNRGFIITALRTGVSNSHGSACSDADGLKLFIVDQHASDEKFRFEGFNRGSRIDRQPLVTPQRLSFTPAQEETATAHLDVFRANGFEISRDDACPPGKRLRLSTVPCIDTSNKADRGFVFGEKDVHDLLFTLDEAEAEPSSFDATRTNSGSGLLDLASHRASLSTKSIPRPKRVWQLLASRACRGACMIGKALRVGEMERILVNLGTLDQPWNCPHGRPTMRHLVDADIAWRRAPRKAPLERLLKEATDHPAAWPAGSE